MNNATPKISTENLTTSKKSKSLEQLEKCADILPIPVYWLDINNRMRGANKKTLKAIGVSSAEEIVGKTAYDVYPKEIAEKLTENQKEVIRTGEVLTTEEMVPNVSGQRKYYTTSIAPLFDDNGSIMGTVCTSVDITQEKKEIELSKKTKVFEHLEKVAHILPTPFYWLDINHRVMGVNSHGLKAVGLSSYEDMIGKTAHDLYPKEMADRIIKHNEEVMQYQKIHSQEESIKDISTGEIKHFNASITPLYDDDGQVIGTIGTSIDITAEKGTARLKLESEKHKIQLQEQEKFSQVANQVAHDIRSPLASLLMVVKSCEEIPEMERVALREAAIRIDDIANHLLNQYKLSKNHASAHLEERESLLISAAISQLLTEKKYEYKHVPITWNYSINPSGHFGFIRIEPNAFKRMISNLVNNAIEALPNKKGNIAINLDINTEWVKISIEDNGKGMPPELIDKIMDNISVTSGKESGHGLGLTQVRETLQKNQGEMKINSVVGKGSQIILSFPKISAPNWIAEKIQIGPSDTILILDDDQSIHGAWRSHFEPLLKKTPTIKLKHFTLATEVFSFLDGLSDDEKKKIFLLSDYELLKQEFNGLDVIRRVQAQRSLLVTSHFANPHIRREAEKVGTKVLPKQLASEIPILINETASEEKKTGVDIIVLDDNEEFTAGLAMRVFKGAVVDQYNHPKHFFEKISLYPKQVKIYLDNSFNNCDTNGILIAKRLHELGYTQLYLLSGSSFEPGTLPDYLTAIRKIDIATIKRSHKDPLLEPV